MAALDTLLDTLEEGRHSFLDFSTFPDLLKSSNPPLSAIRESFNERLFCLYDGHAVNLW